LFAIALQLAVSFGHVHAKDFAGTSATTAVAETPAANLPSQVPAGGDETRHLDCAVCSAIHFAGTSLPSVAPSIVEFAAQGAALAVTSFAAAVPRDVARPFQARAPPSI
jgi:hypothetical protein